jgi:hypothetical protein
LVATEKKKKRRIFSLFREFCAIIFCCYLVVKLAIFDFDTYFITKYFPNFASVLHYKLFLFAAIICILWLSLGRKRFPQFVLFIIVYPIIILIWKIPKIIFRNWSYAMVFAPSFFEFVTKFRTYFIINTLVALSAIFILTFGNEILLSISMLILGTFLIFHLYSSFRKAYRSTIFSKLNMIISKVKNSLSDTSFFQKIWDDANKSNEAKNDEEEFQQRLSTLYLFYWAAGFLGEKVDQFLKSRKMELYLIFTWFWTVFITIIIYSLEYFSLYKLLPNSFNAPFKPTYFSFLGFSFGKLAPTGVSVISPSNMPAILLCYSELACTFVIFIILVFTILTAARERYKEDVYNIVKEMAEIAAILQEKFISTFNMALADAEYVLLTQNASLVNSLRKLRGLPELTSNDGTGYKPDLLEKETDNREEPNKANSADPKSRAAD